MKYIALAAALAVVTACSPAETEEAAEVDTAAVEDTEIVADPIAADGAPTPGTYEVTNSEGGVSTEVINADGTFTSTGPDGEVTTGTWEQRSPEEFCTQGDGEDAMTCYAEGVDADGVWTSVDPDDGEVSTVVRVDADS